MRTLLIDDIRNLPEAQMIARNYWTGILALKSHKWEKLMLDHDIASFENGKELTGMSILEWLDQNREHIPREIELVTQNPVGRQNMKAVLRTWKEQGLIDRAYAGNYPV